MFECKEIGAFISVIELPRIPACYLKNKIGELQEALEQLEQEDGE